MKIAKSKRGINAYDAVYWSARILFVLLMLFFIYFLARYYDSQTLDTTKQEAEIFVRYMLYNPNALPYTDPSTGRTIYGVVDINKLSETTLEKAMFFGEINNMIAANITLTYNVKKEEGKEEVKKIELFYNREKYFNWLPLSNVFFVGIGKVEKIETRRYVIVLDNGEMYPAFINFVVLVPKT
ncbi:MAG: hypothetical protein QXG86_00300 [Candidatus Woesearchaeota archaeon]